MIESERTPDSRRALMTAEGEPEALGFDSARAALMANDAQVDLAQARRLIALGCPLETAARILL